VSDCCYNKRGRKERKGRTADFSRARGKKRKREEGGGKRYILEEVYVKKEKKETDLAQSQHSGRSCNKRGKKKKKKREETPLNEEKERRGEASWTPAGKKKKIVRLCLASLEERKEEKGRDPLSKGGGKKGERKQKGTIPDAGREKEKEENRRVSPLLLRIPIELGEKEGRSDQAYFQRAT